MPAREDGKGQESVTLQKQTVMKEKVLILSVCLLGVLGVGYGMLNRNHPVFIAGLVFVAVGYLMIRRKLKAHISKRYPLEENEKGSRRT